MFRERMYVPQTRSNVVPGALGEEQWAAGRWRQTLWRLRWVVLGLAAAALLALGYVHAWQGGPGAADRTGGTASSVTVTVAPGDTLWMIASRRYPEADPREKVQEIEQLNGLGSPVIEAGQRLRVPRA